MSLINSSFFTAEINIPNTGKLEVNESINMFINKYENSLLQRLLGYELWKAFMASPTEQRFIDLVNGVEYVNFSGKTKKWKGLIYGSDGNPIQQNIVGYTQRKNEQIQVGVNPALVAGATTALFDGQFGKPNYIGEFPIFERVQYGSTMITNVNYTFDSLTGLFSFVEVGDQFLPWEWFNITFNPVPITGYVPPDSTVTYYSLIANYVYWYWMKDNAVWNSGLGTASPNKRAAVDMSPAIKMVNAWNDFSCGVENLYDYLNNSKTVYPEYDSSISYLAFCEFRKTNDFDI